MEEKTGCSQSTYVKKAPRGAGGECEQFHKRMDGGGDHEEWGPTWCRVCEGVHPRKANACSPLKRRPRCLSESEKAVKNSAYSSMERRWSLSAAAEGLVGGKSGEGETE